MSARHELRVKTPAGALVAIITDYWRLSYTKEVNSPGELRFALSGDHAAIAYLERDAQIEVWRADPENGLDWYCDFYAFWRGEERQTNDDGLTTYTAICPGQMDLLRRAIVAYPAGTDNRSSFSGVPAETVLKNLVKYNATSSGTTGDGRVRTVDLSGITVQTDGGGGNTIDFNCAWRILLLALQDAARIAGGDFALVKTGATAWQFRWYAGQLGADRSATVRFSLAHGNMARATLVRDYSRETTIAIVGGQGEEDSRSIVVRNATTHAAGTRSIETFVDARQFTSVDGLSGAGDRALNEARATEDLTFSVMQTPATLYGVHYELGDLVTGTYAGVTAIKKIARVTVTIERDGLERIDIEAESV